MESENNSVMNQLWTEMLRPRKWSDMKLIGRVRKELEQGLIQNVLLYSTSPGSGKSTAARILTDGHPTLKINGSSENGIDVIREQVVSFASTMSIVDGEEGVKVIYIDEADGLSPQAWDALRETIERYADTVRYVCTCNRIDKIPAPIKSRFNCIPFYPLNKAEDQELFDQYMAWISEIATSACHMTFSEEEMRKFVRQYFPDMRTIINTLQSLKLQGVTVLNASSMAEAFSYKDLYNIILNPQTDPIQNYIYIMTNYAAKADDALLAMSKELIEYMRTIFGDQVNYYSPKIPYMIICLSEHVAQVTTSPDKAIVLLSCVFKLQEILKA